MKRMVHFGFGVIMGILVSLSPAQAAEVQSELLEVGFDDGHVVTLDLPFGIQAFSLESVEGIRYRVWHQEWSEWKSVAYEEPGLAWSGLEYLDRTHVLQLKSESRDDLKLFVMQFQPNSELLVSSERLIVQNKSSHFRVITRSEWGADEALATYNPDDVSDESERDPVDICKPLVDAYPGQYQTQGRVDYADRNGRNLIWPREYSAAVKKIVIHHTAQEMKDLNEDGMINMADYRLSVQAIYRFHTVSRGWGDLGYHYLVDPFGNVYEGRAGGKMVIGGHVLCQNSNTIGVSLMGNFENIRVPKQQYDGLVSITKQLVDEYQINAKGKSSFRGKVLPHIVTHAEIGEVTSSLVGRGATACPGRHMKSMMSRLRTAVDGEISVDSGTSYGYSIVELPRLVNVDPLSEARASVQLKNSGSASWSTIELVGEDGMVYGEKSGVFVSSGQSIGIPLSYQAGLEAGRKSLSFSVRVNRSETMDGALKMTFVTPRPRYRYEVMNTSDEPESVLVGQPSTASLQIKNTSNFPWLTTGDHQVLLKPVTRRRTRVFIDPQVPAVVFPNDVLPGETAVVSLELPAQRRKGEVSFEFLPVMGAEKGFQGDPIEVTLKVDNPVFAADLDTVERRLRLQRGTEQLVEFSLKNTSNFDWDPGMVWFQLEGGQRVDVTRRVEKKEGIVLSVPVRAGYGDRQIDVNGMIGISQLPSYLQIQRFREKTISFSDTITASGRPQLVFEKVGQSTDQISRERGEYEEWVEYKNVGNVPWYKEGKDAVTLQIKDKADLLHRSWRGRKIAGILQQDIVRPGEIGTFLLTLEVKRSPRNSVSDTFEPLIEGQRVKVKGGLGKFVVPGRSGASQSSKSNARNLKRGIESNDRKDLDDREDREELVESENAEQQDFSRETLSQPTEQQGSSQETWSQPISSVPPMRVWLSEFDDEVVEISSAGKFEVTRRGTYEEYAGGEVFRILKKDLGEGVVRVQAIDRPVLEVVNWDRSKTFGSTTYHDNFFRNIIEIRVIDGKMTLINELSLEDYMKGIAEVPESTDQPEEKRKTIAVLARSYALHYLISDYKKFPGKPYNAADSPAIFQKYLGYGFELRSPRWQQVLRDTEGEVVLVAASSTPNPLKGEQPLTANNRVLRAAYFSCTDGERTKSWDEVWSGNEYFQRFGDVFQSVGDPLGDDPDRSGFQACGHQVGLSGYGATQMARNGKNYRDIIRYYYRGVSVDKYQ